MARLTQRVLSKGIPDDVLIAKAVEYTIQNQSDTVAVLSDDSAVRLKARGYELSVPTLSADYRLEHEPDPLVLENRKLHVENMRLQNSQPKLQLGFRDSTGNLVSFSHASNDFALSLISEAELDDLIQTERDWLQYVREEQPIKSDRLSVFAALRAILKSCNR